MIVIKQNKQGGDWYYSRDTEGTEKFFDAFCKLNSAAQIEETEADFNSVNGKAEATTAQVKPVKKAAAKADRLTELKGSKLLIYKTINNALRDHYVKLESGEFCDASDAGFTTTGIEAGNPIFDKLYFKDENGAYVEVSEKAIYAFNRLEVEHDIVCDAIKAEIAKTKFKFEVGKWYASDETDWNGDPYGTYHVLKRTKKFVTIYNPDIDDWHYIDNYDPDDEIDGEFDCIFRKKIQFDERGEYVDWRDEDGELVTLCAKDVTDKPVDDDDPKNEIDDNEDEIDAAEDNVETESVNDEKPKHTTDDELNQPTTAVEVLNKLLRKAIANVSEMQITLQDGNKIRRACFSGAYVTMDYWWFISTNWGDTYARYDTPEQFKTVFYLLSRQSNDKNFLSAL